MFLRKDHPKFMKKRQIANSNNKFRKHEKNQIKQTLYDIVDKNSRARDIRKSRFNKDIINREMDMVATNVILYTLTVSNLK